MCKQCELVWPLCECWPVTLGWSRLPSLVKSWAPVQHPVKQHQRNSSNTRQTETGVMRVSQHAPAPVTFTIGTYSSGGAGWMRLDISITAFTSPVTFSYTLSLERSRFAVGGGLISWGWIWEWRQDWISRRESAALDHTSRWQQQQLYIITEPQTQNAFPHFTPTHFQNFFARSSPSAYDYWIWILNNRIWINKIK